MPSGISFTSNGNLLVADSGNSRVLLMSPDGTLLDIPLEPPSPPASHESAETSAKPRDDSEENERGRAVGTRGSRGEWKGRGPRRERRMLQEEAGDMVKFPTQMLTSRACGGGGGGGGEEGERIMCADPKAHCVHILTPAPRASTEVSNTSACHVATEAEEGCRGDRDRVIQGWMRSKICGMQPQNPVEACVNRYRVGHSLTDRWTDSLRDVWIDTLVGLIEQMDARIDTHQGPGNSPRPSSRVRAPSTCLTRTSAH